MEIDKILFGQLSQSKDIDKSFEDLDINNDGKIDEKDKNSSQNSEIKNIISKLLSSDVDEESKCENDEINYKEIYDELKEIQDKKNYDINGDGEVSYGDINALYSLLQHDPDEIFSDSLKITKTRKDGVQYKAFEDAYTQKAKSAFETIIREISIKVRKDTSDKFNVCKSNPSEEELKVSDFIQLYNDIKNLPEGSLAKTSGNLNTTFLYYINNFNLTTAYAQVSESEQAQLKQIVQELSSKDSKISKIIDKGTLNKLKTTADKISENTNIYTNALDKISSQLVNGDIPIGKSITFSLTSANKITITNKNGTYVYQLKRQHTSYDGQTYYETEYLTDTQIDKVLACATDLVNSNGSVGNNSKGSAWTGNGLSSKIKEALGASEVVGGQSYKVTNEKYVHEYTFTNEFGQTSTTYFRDCDACAGSPANAVSDFLFADKIRGLLELAKSKSLNTSTTEINNTSSATKLVSEKASITSTQTTTSVKNEEKTSSATEKIAKNEDIVNRINKINLEKMQKEYDDLMKKIEDTADETEKNNLEDKAKNLKNKILILSFQV